jgi:nitrite reductase/ring-hydroxylating ferredoxin subunit
MRLRFPVSGYHGPVHGVHRMSTRPATAAEVREGQLLSVLVNGGQVVAGRVDGQLYAIDGVCTHQYADLKNERMEGRTVICHFHGSRFDIRTGSVVCPPATKSVGSYRISVDEGRILIDGVQAGLHVGHLGLRDTG